MGITDADLRDVRGERHPTTESVALANERHAKADAERAQREKQEAQQFEAGLKAKFLSVPGSQESDWERNRVQVLDEARRKAALSEDDKARQAFRANYM